jgi:hypothetical protein
VAEYNIPIVFLFEEMISNLSNYFMWIPIYFDVKEIIRKYGQAIQGQNIDIHILN